MKLIVWTPPNGTSLGGTPPSALLPFVYLKLALCIYIYILLRLFSRPSLPISKLCVVKHQSKRTRKKKSVNSWHSLGESANIQPNQQISSEKRYKNQIIYQDVHSNHVSSHRARILRRSHQRYRAPRLDRLKVSINPTNPPPHRPCFHLLHDHSPNPNLQNLKNNYYYYNN